MSRSDSAYRSNIIVKVFNGYGHQHDLVVYGQVRKGRQKNERPYTFNVLRNIFSIIKLYFIRPVAQVRVRLQWNSQSIFATTDGDGFFKMEWISDEPVPGGWNHIRVYLLDHNGNDTIYGEGKMFVPHSTQFGIISDVDDTILVSHSASTGKKLTTLLTTDPVKRKTFADTVNFYQLLSLSHTSASIPNPVFYVSSSEWNLYDYLTDFFNRNELPEGIFLLSDFKHWTALFNIGNTKHLTKGERMRRILDVFPHQRFILLGDNSQKDPVIYSELANEHPGRIEAIYIRMVRPKRTQDTIAIMESIKSKDVKVKLFQHTVEAIDYAVECGIIES